PALRRVLAEQPPDHLVDLGVLLPGRERWAYLALGVEGLDQVAKLRGRDPVVGDPNQLVVEPVGVESARRPAGLGQTLARVPGPRQRTRTEALELLGLDRQAGRVLAVLGQLPGVVGILIGAGAPGHVPEPSWGLGP